MKEKRIHIKETHGLDRSDEFVSIGVPFAQGELLPPHALKLLDGAGAERPLQAGPLATWKDGSAKWLLLDFASSVKAHGEASLRLVPAEGDGGIDGGPVLRREENSWVVETGRCSFYLDDRRFRPFSRVLVEGREVIAPGVSDCRLIDSDGVEHHPVIEEVREETRGAVKVVLFVRGGFPSCGKGAPDFLARLHFYRDSASVKIDFTLRNPHPARHQGGLWDLGDPASFLFRELSFNLSIDAAADSLGLCSTEKGKGPIPFSLHEGFSVYQESSGGENWNSPNHRNRGGEVPLSFKGYRAEKKGGVIEEDLRATPVFWTGSGSGGIGAAMPYFWQEFPKAFSAAEGALRIGLFPREFPDLHELQGGEQKTHTFFLDFSCPPDGLDWVREPLQAVAEAEVYRGSGAIPDLPSGEADGVHGDLVRQAVSGRGSFFDKREVIDEYGWRNFGELYADHEAVYHKGETPFISHYNNQYDPVYSCYRQFLVTSDPSWRQVASELARHVVDIDIYHADGDREEYSNGLFWHTDHYVEAETATHRTHTKEHLKVKNPRFCGGGPGAEHCYTTGLMLHHFLTGDFEARAAVIGLADWSIRALGGSRPLLATLLQAKRTFSRLKEAQGQSPVAFPKYPLSRGTGNTITACLDAFELTGDRKYLSWCETFIRGTVHPDDDIGARDLLNAELAWSYTVFLASVGKYLDKKRSLGEFDSVFAYARESLVAYAEWMLENEYLYLEKPEILEYPNETWAGQDLRKSVVFYYAAKYSEGALRDACVEKAQTFFDGATSELHRWETKGLTRPMVLMLQNGWVNGQLEKTLHTPAPAEAQARRRSGGAIPMLSKSAVIKRISEDLLAAVKGCRPTREMAWLRARLG